MKGLPDKSVDCFVCDLPYGCLTGGGGKEKAKRIANIENRYRKACPPTDRGERVLKDGTIAPTGILGGCPWDIKIDLGLFWEQVKRLSRNDHTPCLMFCSTKFGVELINSNPTWFRHDLVWSKPNGVGFLSANKQPLRSHEMIYVFSKKGAYYKRVDIEGDFRGTSQGRGNVGGSVYALPKNYRGVYGDKTVTHHTREGIRCVKSVVEVSNKKGKGNHPTQKPDELYKWLLERYCVSGGTMLDPTAGSFSSVFVARELGLHAIGIEKDAGFFWKAISKTIYL
jgi:site-specific DNA-methyltransferase (adenine-specific)